MRNCAVFCFLILLGCTTSDEKKISDQAYYPLRIGDYWIYGVDETDILQLTCGTGGQTNKHYQLKDVVVDSAKNSDQGYTYTIHRYSRPDSTQAWVDADLRSARVTYSQVVVNENNVPYVKFTFPLRTSAVWNGNAYNDLGEEDYKAAGLGQSYVLTSGKKFQNTLSVVQMDEQNLVYQDTRIEVYAAAVGLIYKASTELNYFTDAACFGQKEVKNGTIYLQSLISYGHQ